LLNAWLGAAVPGRDSIWTGHLGQFHKVRDRFHKVRDLLDSSVRKFQQAVKLPQAPEGLDDNTRLYALHPYYRLCEVSRRVFQMIYLQFAVAPWELDPADFDLVRRLCDEACGLMPAGRLRLAIEGRLADLDRFLPRGGGDRDRPGSDELIRRMEMDTVVGRNTVASQSLQFSP
jgi:hypothetical protein